MQVNSLVLHYFISNVHLVKARVSLLTHGVKVVTDNTLKSPHIRFVILSPGDNKSCSLFNDVTKATREMFKIFQIPIGFLDCNEHAKLCKEHLKDSYEELNDKNIFAVARSLFGQTIKVKINSDDSEVDILTKFSKLIDENVFSDIANLTELKDFISNENSHIPCIFLITDGTEIPYYYNLIFESFYGSLTYFKFGRIGAENKDFFLKYAKIKLPTTRKKHEIVVFDPKTKTFNLIEEKDNIDEKHSFSISVRDQINSYKEGPFLNTRGNFASSTKELISNNFNLKTRITSGSGRKSYAVIYIAKIDENNDDLNIILSDNKRPLSKLQEEFGHSKLLFSSIETINQVFDCKFEGQLIEGSYILFHNYGKRLLYHSNVFPSIDSIIETLSFSDDFVLVKEKPTNKATKNPLSSEI